VRSGPPAADAPDGTPFTSEETDLLTSVTDDGMRRRP